MTTTDSGAVAAAVALVRRRIAAIAGERSVQLVAVTKGFDAAAIDAAIAAGCDAIGENYAQELVAKLAMLGAGPSIDVHFIGHLQSNKVRALAGVVNVWETLDRASVIEEVAKRAAGARVFVQVNSTGENSKAGCPPSAAAALVDRCREAGLGVEGLMTMGPTSGDPGGAARAFRLTRRIADDLGLTGCSMGMSGDFEIAVEQGATHVRLGSVLFGERPHPRA